VSSCKVSWVRCCLFEMATAALHAHLHPVTALSCTTCTCLHLPHSNTAGVCLVPATSQCKHSHFPAAAYMSSATTLPQDTRPDCFLGAALLGAAVPADNGNLCQAVSKVLATARRAKGLDAQLRLLAKCERELLLQLEAQREATARAERAGRHWQVRGRHVCSQAVGYVGGA
jgi:hypothetical protein